MLRMIRNIVEVDIKDLLLELGIQAAAWVLAEGIAFAVVHLDTTASTAPAAGTAAVVYGGLVCMVITNVIRFLVDYKLYLCFPLTRRVALLGHLAAMLTHDAVLAAGAVAWAGVGAALHPLLYAGTGLSIAPTFAYTPWPAWLALLLVPPTIAVVVGGVVARFGRAGGWALYGVCMVCCLMLDDIIDGLTNGLDALIASSVWPLFLLGGALTLAALLALCARWLLRIHITG